MKNKKREAHNQIISGTIYATIIATVFFFSCPKVSAFPLFGSSKSENKKDVKVIEEKKNDNKTFYTARTVIEAPPRIVWEAVHEERQHDPDLEYNKILEKGENKCRLEQKFKLIPVIGSAVCEMKNWEVPLKRIDYKLIKSDRFKSMEGSWVLTSKDNGRSTLLELSTHLDLGFPVPGTLMKSVTSKKLTRRLTNVKKMAEDTQRKLAVKPVNAP